MTNKEAIKAIRDNYPTSRYSILRESLEMAIKALEKSEKYRWHDLRKNPDDLPTEDKLYNILVLMSGSYVYISANWNCLIKNWIYDSQYELRPHTVISWKAIEPFEVEE